MKKIVCFHLLNDYSGSPKVLEMVLKGLALNGFQIDLYTSKGGVLDDLTDIPNIKIFYNNYKFVENSWFQYIRFLFYQIFLFVVAFKYILNKKTVFYVNTLLPVGPAFAGWLMREKIFFHYHENADIKGVFYRKLLKAMIGFSNKVVCVSKYQADRVCCENKIIIPNSFPKKFTEISNEFTPKRKGNILMLASLKKYKGVIEFVQLARLKKELNFVLILNASKKDVSLFVDEENIFIPSSLKIESRIQNVKPFYKDASVVLNLSNPSLFIETFGMTIIEAMSVGLPVIGPKVGGVEELIENGVNGYKVDVTNVDEIAYYIDLILSDEDVYKEMSVNSKRMAQNYTYEMMIGRWINILKDE